MIHEPLTDKTVVVVGLGVSGLAVARFARSDGARVVLNDHADSGPAAEAAAAARAEGFDTVMGSHPAPLFESADIIVVSPGVPETLPVLAAARDRGTPVVGEMALAAARCRRPMAAITGTNGKTTVTTLIGQMLEKAGINAFVGGNIGTPLIDFIANGQTADCVVVEVSSFQLDTMDRFTPDVAVLLNITEDHLDRYADMDAYADSKMRICNTQGNTQNAVLNWADTRIRNRSTGLPGTLIPYGPEPVLPADAAHTVCILEDRIRIAAPDRAPMTLRLETARLPGGHNRENIAAAATAAHLMGASADAIQTVVDTFGGLPHRMEPVAVRSGIRFVDDSKATNIDAVRRALKAIDGPVVLILGGRDKGGDYRILRNDVAGRVSALVAIGEAADLIVAALGDVVPADRAVDMDHAVVTAYGHAAPGHTVLLSPACSSFDMFTSYSHRGRVFQDAVSRLPEAPH